MTRTVVLPDSSTKIGGGQRSLLLLASGLMAGGEWRPVLVVPAQSELRKLAADVPVIAYPTLRPLGVPGADRLLAAAAALGAVVYATLGQRAALIHTNQLDMHFVGWLAAKLTRRPVVFHKRLLLGHGVLDQVYRLASFTIAVSNAALEQVLALGVAPARAVTVPNGAPTLVPGDIPSADLRRRHGLAPDVLLLGTLCRLSREKGLEHLLRATRLILDRGHRVHVFIAGETFLPRDETYRDELIALAAALGLTRDVTFLGFRPDPLSVIRDLDIAVLPSLTEAFPRFPIEAAMMGKAIVATDVGGTPELVIDGVTGLLVPPGDAAALAAGLIALCTDAARAERMGQAALVRARAELTVERYVARVADVYASVLSGASG